MRQRILLMTSLIGTLVSPAAAGTFSRTAIAPDLGLESLTRSIARERLGKRLFAQPYATVTLSEVDVHDRFPYVESRHFQIVSDPAWNRIVLGETGRSLQAFDGSGTEAGRFASPHGLSLDEMGRLYIADTGNDRIVVFQTRTEAGRLSLTRVAEIAGVKGPIDVAVSDAGTPFTPADDVVFVAESGGNRVSAHTIAEGAPRRLATIGTLGSGSGAFAGPMSVAVGRAEGVHTPDVYVADAHNQRIVHLRFEAGRWTWSGDAPSPGGVVTSLDTDQWGNLYAASPQRGSVRKYGPALAEVAELRDAVARPRSFRVPFFVVRDHRDGSRTRIGQASAVSLDEWGDQSGLRLWDLGVEITGLAVTGGDAPEAGFTLTDRAAVTWELSDPRDGRVLLRRSAGTLEAGVHRLALPGEDLSSAAGPFDAVLKLVATSTYARGASAVALSPVRLTPDGLVTQASRPALLGNWPNPVRPSTRIAFVLPPGTAESARFGIYDAMGRQVRGFAGAFRSGVNELLWDGTDAEGRAVRSGLYFYRLDADGLSLSRRMTLVR